MASNWRSWIQIFIHYRAVAHIIEALGIVYIIIMILSDRGLELDFNIFDVIYVACGICEYVKGHLLLYAIMKENKKKTEIYVALHGVTLIVKIILTIDFMAILRTHTRYHFFDNFSQSFQHYFMNILIIAAILYFAYEWIMFGLAVRFFVNMKHSL